MNDDIHMLLVHILMIKKRLKYQINSVKKVQRPMFLTIYIPK